MLDVAYVQKVDGEWINETAHAMQAGCQMLGIPVQPFREQDVDHLDLTPSTLVHGWVRCVHRAFDRLGVPRPTVDGMPPEELLPMFGRRVWRTTLGDIHALPPSRLPVFVKPALQHKAFPGHTITGFRDLIGTASFDFTMDVVASETVKFISEWRGFVHQGVLVDCRPYKGDFTERVDYEVAYACIRAWKDAPVAYSVDLGVTDDGRTLVVEINDAYSLGGYGLPPVTYANMIVDRWCEIVRPSAGKP